MVIVNVWMTEMKRHFNYIKTRSARKRNITNKYSKTQVHTKTCAILYNIVLKRTHKNKINYSFLF